MTFEVAIAIDNDCSTTTDNDKMATDASSIATVETMHLCRFNSSPRIDFGEVKTLKCTRHRRLRLANPTNVDQSVVITKFPADLGFRFIFTFTLVYYKYKYMDAKEIYI